MDIMTLTLVTVMKMAGAPPPPPPGPASRVCSWLSRNRCLPDIPNIVFWGEKIEYLNIYTI